MEAEKGSVQVIKGLEQDNANLATQLNEATSELDRLKQFHASRADIQARYEQLTVFDIFYSNIAINMVSGHLH